MEGGVSHSDLAVVNPPSGVVGEPLTPIVNRKLDWIFGVNTDVRAWIMSYLAPG